MGGNAVVLLTSRAGQTASATGSSQTNVTLTATVYNCPDSAF
jgi:hypothetical protein